MVHLTLDDLSPYLGGELEIRKTNEYDYRGGIKTMSIIGNILKIKFIWKLQFEGWPSKNPRWIHVPELTEYDINLEGCIIPGWEKVEKKTIFLYSANHERITFHMANGNNHIKPLDTEGCPATLASELQEIKEQFLVKMDLNKVPRVNFNVDQIQSEAYGLFIRVDLKWKGAVWSFIRIQDSPEDNHIRIYYGLIHEIAEQFMLEGYDIENLLSNRDHGYLCLKDNRIDIMGYSSYFREETTHELTKSILEIELSGQINLI